MKLYLKDYDGQLKLSTNFPMASAAIGNYIHNVHYIPDEEFDRIMGELQQPRTIINPNKPEERINNEVITVFQRESNDNPVIASFLRPDRFREKDREDWLKVKEDKAKGIVNELLRKN